MTLFPDCIQWRLGYTGPNGLELLSSTDMAECRFDGFRYIWHGSNVLGPSFQVTCQWKPLPSDIWEGTLEWSGGNSDIAIEQIDFPMRDCPMNAHTRLLWGGLDTGLLITGGEYFTAGVDYELDRPGMPLFAIMQPDGLNQYFDVRDPDCHVTKSFIYRISEDATRVFCGYRHQLDIQHGDCGSLPYAVTAGDFIGNWFDAGQLYKPWAVSQRWFTSRSGINPLRDIDLWVWNRGVESDVIPPMLKLQNALPGVKTALDWYWWHHNPYDTDYPAFWPPRSGESPFMDAIKTAKAAGIFTQVYINGVCADIDSSEFARDDASELLMNRDGTHRSNAFNHWNHHRLAWMCGEAPRFQTKIEKLVDHLHDSGLDGQYIDQVAFSTARRCYNPAHHHAPGGGTFMVQLWRDYMKRIKDSHPDMPLSSEACNEFFMDIFDGAIACNSVSAERFYFQGEPVPLFTSIYHGPQAMAVFGNYALPTGIPPWDPLWPADERWRTEEDWNRIFPEQFYIEVLRDVVWGMQPMVQNLTDEVCTSPEYHEPYQFILHAARFWHDHKDFLFDGTMLAPEILHCARRTVKMFSRGIFTLREKVRTLELDTPVILHGVWQSPEGAKALILGNITDTPQSWSWNGLSGILPPHRLECVTIPKPHSVASNRHH